MPRRRRYFGLLLVAVLAASAQSLVADPSAAITDRVAALARRLAAADFAQRQQAEADLLVLGPDALPALRKALPSAELEAHYRLERIIAALDQVRREQILSEFRMGGQPNDPSLLTAWVAFSRLAGDGPEARALLAEMARVEPWIVAAVSGPAEQLRSDFERRAADVNLHRVQRQQSQRSVATVAALLFAAQLPDCHPSPSVVACINACVTEGPYLESMERVQRPQPLERLVAVWVSDPTTTPALQRLQLAARFELIEGIDVALQIIEEQLPGPQLQQAVLYLAKAGNVSHLHQLELLLSDATDLQQRRQNSVTTFSSRVQDVALVALLHLTGQDPEEYGFSGLREDQKYVYLPGTIGFDTDEQRQMAFSKWKRWSAEHLKQVQPVVEQAAAGYSA
ncbi:MAG: hypothetical protein WD176_01870 [Pirellulales bacterium]